MTKEKYHIEDEDVLNAVSSHNFGSPGMSMLEKIVYIADYIEPNRDFAPEKLNYYRSLAYKDLDKCLVLILKDTIDFVNEGGYPLVPISYETYVYYKNAYQTNPPCSIKELLTPDNIEAQIFALQDEKFR